VLPVEADVARRLLDHAVRLAGDDEAVVGEADVEPLAAAVQREQHRVGRLRAHRPDRDRSLERGDRAAERLDDVAPARRVPADESRDHLRVGGDVLVDAELVLDPEVGVVVDVAVERGHHVRARPGGRRRFELVTVDRVGVGFGDDADAGPAGVAEHRRARVGVADREAQQRVGRDRRAQRPGVVTELTDLGRRLVDERQHPVGHAHRAGLVGRVLGAVGDRLLDRRICEIEPVPVHEHVDAGGVAAAHLEPVERRQRLLDGEVGRRCAEPRAAARECGDLARGAQAVVSDRPERVAERDRCRVAAFELVGRQLGTLQRSVDRVGDGVELVETAGDRGDQLELIAERDHAGEALEQRVGALDRSGHRSDVAGGGERPVEQSDDLAGGRRRPGWTSPDHADDAAHGSSGY
jgi:hypothetical protein